MDEDERCDGEPYPGVVKVSEMTMDDIVELIARGRSDASVPPA